MRPKTFRILVAVSVAALCLIALLALLHSPAARAESGSFQIAQHGHGVGTASFQFTPTSQGYNSTSLVRVTMQGLDYALSKNEQLTRANHLLQAQVSATVNGSAVEVTARPQGGQVQLAISANGRRSAVQLPAHPGAVLVPDFDPGALQTLLVLAARQNNRNLWAIIPKRAGFVEAVQLATYQDMQGSLNGKAVTVHHLEAMIAGTKTELFCDPQSELLQAELPQDGFALVRNGFVLNPPAKAPAPPPAPPQQQPTQPQN